jgi:hypothetical protein
MAVATTVYRGRSESALEVRLVGCTEKLPALKERGLFFVNPDGSAITVWESNQKEFNYWLEQLRVKTHVR